MVQNVKVQLEFAMTISQDLKVSFNKVEADIKKLELGELPGLAEPTIQELKPKMLKLVSLRKLADIPQVLLS